MNKIIAFIAICAAIVVGAKFYLEYRYKKELDNILRGVSYVAEVEYKDLNIGFDGAMELQGLTITPSGTFDTFKVKSIQLSGLDLMFHFNGQSRLKAGELPKFLNFKVENFSFPASFYEQQFAAEECKSFQGTALYSSAGFDQVLADADIQVDLADPFSASVVMNASDQASNTQFLVNFNAREMSASALMAGAIPVQSLSYSYSLDERAAESMLAYCANKFKVTPEVFVDKVVKSDKFMANTVKLDLGDKAQEALAALLQGGKEISIQSTPSDRLKNMSFASTSSLAQIVRMLNLTVTLDGSNVPIRTFKTSDGGNISLDDGGENQGYQRRDLEELLSTPDGTVQERVKPTLRKRPKIEYDAVTLRSVNDYIDRDIRLIRSKERSPIEGRLLSAENEVLSVEINRYGGVMKYTVPYEDIVKFEIRKR